MRNPFPRRLWGSDQSNDPQLGAKVSKLWRISMTAESFSRITFRGLLCPFLPQNEFPWNGLVQAIDTDYYDILRRRHGPRACGYTNPRSSAEALTQEVGPVSTAILAGLKRWCVECWIMWGYLQTQKKTHEPIPSENFQIMTISQDTRTWGRPTFQRWQQAPLII